MMENLNRQVDSFLRLVRARIEKPKNWTPDELAVDKDGNVVSVGESRATAWDLMGAVWAESLSFKGEVNMFDVGMKLINKATAPYQESNAYEFGRAHTHAEVLSLLDGVVEEVGRRACA